MPAPANFGDSAFEPTDEQLQQLSHEAFAEVADRNRAADARLRSEIARLRAEAIARMTKKNDADGGPRGLSCS